MNRVSGVMKIHFRDKMSWIFVPWIIVLVSFLVNLIIAVSTRTPTTVGSLASIYIYFLVIGIVTIKETFPFAVGLSIRRKDYLLGTMATALLVSAASALMLVLLQAIERATGGWGAHLSYFAIPFLSDFSWLSQLGIFGIVLLHNYFLGFAISSIHRRFGRNGMFIFFPVLLVLGIVGSYLCTRFEVWGAVGRWLVHHYPDLFWWMVPAAAIYMGVSYLLLRKAAA